MHFPVHLIEEVVDIDICSFLVWDCVVCGWFGPLFLNELVGFDDSLIALFVEGIVGHAIGMVL
jgi:hypothetical protein